MKNTKTVATTNYALTTEWTQSFQRGIPNSLKTWIIKPELFLKPDQTALIVY